MEMDLLAEYKQCLATLRTLQAEDGTNQADLARFTRDIKSSQSAIEMLKVQMQTASEVQTRQKLAELIAAKRNSITQEIDQIEHKIKAIVDRSTAEKQEVMTSITLQQFPSELALIKRARGVLANGQRIISESMPASILASVQNAVVQDTNTYDIATLTRKVEEHLDSVPDTIDVSIFKKVIKGIMLDTEIFSQWSPKARLGVYLLWIVVLGALLLYAPLVVILPYSTLLIGSVASNIGRSQKLMNFCYPYKLLEDRVNRMSQDLNQQVEQLRGREYIEINRRRDTEISTLQDVKKDLQKKLETAEMEVRASTSVEDIQGRVRADFQSKIDEAMQQQVASTKALERTNKYIRANARQYEDTLAKKEKLKHEVREYYLSPTTPGKSKLLTSSFFLGMDNQEELIEFDYKGTSTLIIYKGENSTVNAPLITMMLMQLLASMSIISLQLAITDVHNACTSYAQFSPKKLSSRIRLCATDSEVSDVVEQYHTEMLMRNKTILTEAPSIDEYNRQMLERKSLTREYYILFLQDPDFKLLSSQKFLQLCRTGPKVGIIPLVFISHADMNKMRSEKDEVRVGLLDFLEIVSENTYNFNGSTQDLVEDDAGVCQVIDDIRREEMRK